jgi:hypothetical protein
LPLWFVATLLLLTLVYLAAAETLKHAFFKWAARR